MSTFAHGIKNFKALINTEHKIYSFGVNSIRELRSLSNEVTEETGSDDGYKFENKISHVEQNSKREKFFDKILPLNRILSKNISYQFLNEVNFEIPDWVLINDQGKSYSAQINSVYLLPKNFLSSTIKLFCELNDENGKSKCGNSSLSNSHENLLLTSSFNNYCDQNILSGNSKIDHINIRHIRQYSTNKSKKLPKENPSQKLKFLSAKFLNKLRSINEVVIRHSSNGEKLLSFIDFRSGIPISVIVKQTAARIKNHINKVLIDKKAKVKINNKNNRLHVSRSISEILKVKRNNSELNGKKIVKKLAKTSSKNCFKKFNVILKKDNLKQSTILRSRLNNIDNRKSCIKKNCKYKLSSVSETKRTPRTVENQQRLLLYLKLYPTVLQLHKTLSDKNVSSKRCFSTLPRNRNDGKHFLQPDDKMNKSKGAKRFESNSPSWDNLTVAESQVFENYSGKDANNNFRDFNSYMKFKRNHLNISPETKENIYKNEEACVKAPQNDNTKYENSTFSTEEDQDTNDERNSEIIPAGLLKCLTISKDVVCQMKGFIGHRNKLAPCSTYTTDVNDNIKHKIVSNALKLAINESKDSEHTVGGDKIETTDLSNKDKSSQNFEMNETETEKQNVVDEATESFSTDLNIQIEGELVSEENETNKFIENEVSKNVKNQFKKKSSDFIPQKPKTVYNFEVKPVNSETTYNVNKGKSNEEVDFENIGTSVKTKPEKHKIEYNFNENKFINKINTEIKKEKEEKLVSEISKSEKVATVYITSDGKAEKLNFNTKVLPEPSVKFKPCTKEEKVGYSFNESKTRNDTDDTAEHGTSKNNLKSEKTAVNREKFLSFLKDRQNHKFLIAKMFQSKTETDNLKSDSADDNKDSKTCKESKNLSNVNETTRPESKTNLISKFQSPERLSKSMIQKSKSTDSHKKTQPLNYSIMPKVLQMDPPLTFRSPKSSPTLISLTSSSSSSLRNKNLRLKKMNEDVKQERCNPITNSKNFYNNDFGDTFPWKKNKANDAQYINYFKCRFQSRG